MSITGIGRIFWKQYRESRAFWGGMLALGLFLQWMLAWSRPRIDGASAGILFFVISALTVAFYALGVGATAFAMERENGTVRWLRVLPVQSRDLVAGIFGFALASCVLLVGVRLLSTLVLWLASVPATWTFVLPRLLPVQAATLIAELLAWGLLFLLLVSRPLLAIVLAGLADFLYLQTVGWFLGTAPILANAPLAGRLQWLTDAVPWPVRLLVVAILLVVVDRRAQEWCQHSRVRIASAKQIAIPTARRFSGSNTLARISIWKRLLWQQWHGTRHLLLILAAIGVATSLLWFAAVLPLVANRGLFFLTPPMILVSMLIGLYVFRLDQHRRQYRFLVIHGISPTVLWLSRQIYWSTVLLLWLIMTSGFCVVVNIVSHSHGVPGFRAMELPESIRYVFIFCLVAYCLGQFWSMRINRILLAGLATWLSLLLVAFWIGLVGLPEMPMSVGIWAVIPIPLILLVASWRYTSTWIMERRGLGVWLQTAVWIWFPLILLGAAVATYRGLEIPAIDPGIKLRRATPTQRAAYQKAAKLYQEIEKRLVVADAPPNRFTMSSESNQIEPAAGTTVGVADRPIPSHPSVPSREGGKGLLVGPLSKEEQQWLDENRAVLPLAIEASRQSDYLQPLDTCHYLLPNRPDAVGNISYQTYKRLLQLLVISARDLERQGELDQALQRYFVILRIIRQQRDGTAGSIFRLRDRIEPEAVVLFRLTYWARLPGQTPDRIRRALKQLAAIQKTLPRYHRRAEEAHYYLAMEFAKTDALAALWQSDRSTKGGIRHWLHRLLLWEQVRLQHFLDQQMWFHQQLLHKMQETLASNQLRDAFWLYHPTMVPPYLRPRAGNKSRPTEIQLLVERSRMLRHWSNTTPTAYCWRSRPASDLHTMLVIETARRMCRIAMILEVWRLEHGNWPGTLETLATGSVSFDPIEPLYGEKFKYRLVVASTSGSPHRYPVLESHWFFPEWSDRTRVDEIPRIMVNWRATDVNWRYW